MPKYLTTARFKQYVTGMSLSNLGINDLQLALIIDEAENQIDGHMGMDSKTGGFEPGIRLAQYPWDNETRQGDLPNIYLPARSVVAYDIQISNLSTSGSGFFAEINPGDVAINNFQDYIEIVPLQAITYSVFPGAMDFGLNPPIVKVQINQGYYLVSLLEQLIDTGDHKTYLALRGFWETTYSAALALQPATLPPAPPLVYNNGTLVSSSLYTINAVEGEVVFNSAFTSPYPTITASYTYGIPDVVKTATVKQVTYLLQRIRMNQLGLFIGVQKVKSGDQEIQGPNRPMQEMVDGLCEDAADILDKAYGKVGIA